MKNKNEKIKLYLKKVYNDVPQHRIIPLTTYLVMGQSAESRPIDSYKGMHEIICEK